jgi:regulator of sirC expression with transglutaminase-like and TPR domain
MIDPSAALDAVGLLPDSEIDIADAALLLARVGEPGADWQAARVHLSELARDAASLASRMTDTSVGARADALAELIVGRHDYTGDAESYDDLANANLIRVIERRRGLPVALGIIWLHCSHASGWAAHGIDFPGHFLVGLEAGGAHAVLDVFAGGKMLDARSLRAMLKSVEGGKAELRPELLRPMSTRAVLLRLQQNIKVRRLRSGQLEAALACTETTLRFAPEHAALWQEAALIHQRLDHVAAALRCFERFLALVPKGDVATRAHAMMDELRMRLN